MAGTDPKAEDTYSEAETVTRREVALKNLLATPHKRHEPIGKKRAESSQSK
jgi:hypothetical protein